MVRKKFKYKIIFIITVIVFIIIYFLCINSLLVKVDKCNCKINENTETTIGYKNLKINNSKHKLAILVPYRDRFEELLEFAPHMKLFLDKQNLNYDIYILNQVDNYRFNRASLINVGFIELKNKFDYIAMHDVDLLPLNDNLKYNYPDKNPIHISSPDYHPRYHYKTFIGGILLLIKEQFILVNGMSNNYWGWGLEDDEFYLRLKEAGFVVDRPTNITTGVNGTFKHKHSRFRKRDMDKCFGQEKITRRRDRKTGLNNVSYKIKNIVNATISGTPITILNILLNCNQQSTPWCICNPIS